MKKSIQVTIILALLMLCGCGREHITVEYSEKDNITDDAGNDNNVSEKTDMGEDRDSSQGAKNDNGEYRINKYGIIEPEDECTRFIVYFPYTDSKNDRMEKWSSICNLSGVERTELLTGTEASFCVKPDNINPKYYDYYVDGDEEIKKTIDERGLYIRAHIYTANDVEGVTLFMCRKAQESLKDGWNVEEWPFRIEKNEQLELEYVDWLGDDKKHVITVDNISDRAAWYLDYERDNTTCNILMSNELYKEIFGEDHDGKNIDGLYGHESFIVQSSTNMKDAVKEAIMDNGAEEISNSFFKEE